LGVTSTWTFWTTLNTFGYVIGPLLTQDIYEEFDSRRVKPLLFLSSFIYYTADVLRFFFCYLLSSVGIVTGYRLDDMDSIPAMARFFFSAASRPTLRPTHPLQWLQRLISLGVKWPGHETDHSPPTTAEEKNGRAIPPLPHMSSWHSAYLIKHRNNCTI
jgi:hypothetical protein